MQPSVEEKRAQTVGAVVHPQDHIAPPAAIPAIGPAFGPEFAAVKVHSAITAAPGATVNPDMIYKHGSQLAADEGSLKAKGWPGWNNQGLVW